MKIIALTDSQLTAMIQETVGEIIFTAMTAEVPIEGVIAITDVSKSALLALSTRLIKHFSNGASLPTVYDIGNKRG